MDFPETRVAAVEHRGPPYLEHQTVRRLVEWRMQNGLPPARHRCYGVHCTDPRTTAPDDHRVDFCVSVVRDYPPNPQGVMNKTIPGGRCAVVRHLGARVIKDVIKGAKLTLFLQAPRQVRIFMFLFRSRFC